MTISEFDNLPEAEKAKEERRGEKRKERLHSTQGGVGEAAAQTFSSVAGLVAMLLVKQGVKRSMEGLYLRL